MPNRIKIPRIKAPPRFFTRNRPAVTRTPKFEVGSKPASFPGTYPEFLVYQWLQRQGFVEGMDFRYQVSLEGGRRSFFGAVVDFMVYTPRALLWRVNGWFWHYVGNETATTRDLVQKIQLEKDGYVVVDILDIDLLDADRRDYVLNQALLGIDLTSIRLPMGKPGTYGVRSA